MFWSFADGKMTQIEASEVDENVLTSGYLSYTELKDVYEKFGFSSSTVERCNSASGNFRSSVEVYDSYTFTELRIVDAGTPSAKEDCVALYIKKNLMLVIDVEDNDGSTKSKLIGSLSRHNFSVVTLEKLICSFLDSLVSGDQRAIENLGYEAADMEERLLDDDADKEFNRKLLGFKKTLLRLHNYYDQLLDIAEALEENENDIFPADDLMFVANLESKVTRLREDIDSLSRSVEHLQDAYSSFLDLKLNNHMKIFTVITTIFFPLTIIVGWYGMNFQTMPEFAWKYGYLYVIILSILVVIALGIYGKRKKWF